MNSNNLINELVFKAVRSSGAGGQHVNKVSSKIELSFDIVNSNSLSEEEKERLLNKLQSKLTKKGVLILSCDESRSQHKNKEIVIERLLLLLKKALQKEKPRKQTKPTKSSIEKRLEKKKKDAFKKALRKKPGI